MIDGERLTTPLRVADDYADRPGYQAAFLGPGLEISLPRVLEPRAGDVASLVDGSTELKYWTYSSLMSLSRRLPILCAGNFDRNAPRAKTRPQTWFSDPRLAATPEASAAHQVVNDWYRGQPRHEGDDGRFDRGHLVAYQNSAWGEQSARNGADSFHFTNCAPQAKPFNEFEIWREIEVWCAAKGESGLLCMFNGPIFDGPISTALDDGEFRLELDAPAALDPEVNGVPIPKQYFKVVAYPENDGYAVQAFIVTQEGFIGDLLEGLTGVTPRQLSLYRVSLSAIQALTSVDFAPLADGSRSTNALAPILPELITELDQI